MTKAEADELLAECRRKIDAIDLELRNLLNRRTEIVVDVLRAKDALEMPVYEANREELVLQRVTEGNPGPLEDASVRRLFACLMQEMRVFQDSRRQRHAEQPRHSATEPAE
jgi:chorismate mutase